MAKIYLRIRWEYSTEFLEFDPKDLRLGAKLKRNTEEFWDGSEVLYEYVVTCEDLHTTPAGTLRVVLRYDEKANLQTIRDKNVRGEIAWGRTRLTIRRDGASVAWDDDKDKADSGPGKCRVLDWSLWKKAKLVTRMTRERGRQADFRRLLLERDRRCAISGVSFEAMLDAAHVIPHANDGNTSLKNGLVLRSDLHRLFDNYYRTAGDPTEHWLRVKANGKVQLSASLRTHSDYERFDNVAIPKKTYDRIREGLAAAERK
jgi:hypothetical protein